MAVLDGISGNWMLDGAGGNIALDIQKGILRILSDSAFVYKTATILNKGEIKKGSVSYALPEIAQTEDYGQDGGSFQNIAANLVKIPINIRRWVGVEYESFDYSRLGDFQAVVPMVINSIAMSIENDLNAHFWNFIATNFKQDNGPLRKQSIVMPGLVEDYSTAANGVKTDDIKKYIYQLQRHYLAVNKTWNKNVLGIPKAELMLILDTYADLNIRQAYDGQPNALAERTIAKDLVGVQIGTGVYYITDKMLGENIKAGTSFSKDKALDLSNFIGLICHNEAIAMPFNFHELAFLRNPKNNNPRLICKYQFGLGFVRPTLCWAIVKQQPAARGKNEQY